MDYHLQANFSSRPPVGYPSLISATDWQHKRTMTIGLFGRYYRFFFTSSSSSLLAYLVDRRWKHIGNPKLILPPDYWLLRKHHGYGICPEFHRTTFNATGSGRLTEYDGQRLSVLPPRILHPSGSENSYKLKVLHKANIPARRTSSFVDNVLYEPRSRHRSL